MIQGEEKRSPARNSRRAIRLQPRLPVRPGHGIMPCMR
jgi:hypothetical protein